MSFLSHKLVNRLVVFSPESMPLVLKKCDAPNVKIVRSWTQQSSTVGDRIVNYRSCIKHLRVQRKRPSILAFIQILLYLTLSWQISLLFIMLFPPPLYVSQKIDCHLTVLLNISGSCLLLFCIYFRHWVGHSNELLLVMSIQSVMCVESLSIFEFNNVLIQYKE